MSGRFRAALSAAVVAVLAIGAVEVASTPVAATPPDAQGRWVVDSLADSPDVAPGNGDCADAGGACTMRAATAEAAAQLAAGQDATITFASNTFGQTIPIGDALIVDVPVNRVLTIQGSSGPRPTLDGGDDDRILILTGTGAATIFGVNFQNGATDGSLPAGGGAINSSLSSLGIDTSRISSSSAVVGGGNFGGGILSTGQLTLSYAEIIGNTAGALGGGISAQGGVAITGSSIRGNTSGGDGGGLFALGTVRVESSEIAANTAEGDGGGIDCECDQLIVQTVSLVDNVATTGQGGGIFGFPPSAFIINVSASGNIAGNGGGAVSMLPGSRRPDPQHHGHREQQRRRPGSRAARCRDDHPRDGEQHPLRQRRRGLLELHIRHRRHRQHRRHRGVHPHRFR